MKKIKIERKYWMIFLTVIMLSGMLTSFMYKPVSTMKATIIIRFNDNEIFELPASIDDNTTMLKAVSGYYYIRMDNESLKCIRNTCNNNESKWLAFDQYGVSIKPENYKLTNGEKTYLLYNSTSGNSTADEQAIRGLLKL